MTGHTTPRGFVPPGRAAAGAKDADEKDTRDTSVIDSVTVDIAWWSAGRGLSPITLSAFSLGFAIIAAVWLTGISAHADAVAFVALVASYVTCRTARYYSSGQLTAAADWAHGACALLAELAVYAGIAGGVSANVAASAGTGLTGLIGDHLRGTFLASFGGSGPTGVWRLAIAAAILLAVREMANICLAAAKERTAVIEGQQTADRILVPAPASGARLVALCVAVILVGARGGFVLVLLLGVLALLIRIGVVGPNSGVIGYRGDGPLSVWIGSFVAGRLPPVPPLVVGLLVTGALTWLGMGNLSGILLLTPAEAMLLAALGCWHPHDGPRDWLAPALLQAGEYVFIAAVGFAGKVPAPVTFALITGVIMRHFDLAYRARNQVSPALFIRQAAKPPVLAGADWRGLGWEGRMIVAGIAAAAGILSFAFPLCAIYMWALLLRDAYIGWSAGHTTIDS
ncbi:MAG TPA: DUF5941 domain-containing protein [Trebonia sp.]|jgi:hypothetical protein|nr:DUF5941 domain-containing protein [Trebonia sp.]